MVTENNLATDISWLIEGRAVYHYTTAEGLLGILTSGRIWASSVLHMNDASELLYAQKLYLDELDAYLRSMERREVLNDLDFAVTLTGIGRGLIEEVLVFAACFCRNGDLLSQWRGYGGAGGGYALGLDLPLTRATGWEWWDLVEVVYEESQQRQRFRSFFERTLKRAREEPWQGPGHPWPPIADIQREALYLLATCKSPAFSEEQEIRLVTWRHISAPLDVKWRPGRNLPVPYVEVSLTEDSSLWRGKPPVVDIVVGPTSHFEAQDRAFRFLLRQGGYQLNGYERIRIRRSAVPLRF